MKDAEIMQNRLIESTQAEIQNLYRQQERELALERERTRRELRSEIMDLAVMAAAKALRSRITPAVQSAVIDQVLEELDKLPQNS
jgi:F0F1-type ATP synthase membrane subunit b/b'